MILHVILSAAKNLTFISLRPYLSLIEYNA